MSKASALRVSGASPLFMLTASAACHYITTLHGDAQQSKDKEKKQKVDSGSIEELNLKIETLEAEKKAEQESRSLMQLERVCCWLLQE